jgi:Flp pilus assembly protein TadB
MYMDERTADAVQTAHSAPPAAPEASAGELVRQLSEQVSALVRDELKLAQLEMSRKGKQAGLGIGMFGASGLVALYAVGCLLACAVIAISGVVTAWLAALIIGAALLAVSGAAALLGKRRLRRSTPPVPEQAVGSVKADVEEIKERAHR